MDNYQSTTLIHADAAIVYKALTHDIARWWSEDFEGSGKTHGGTFTVRFGGNIYKVFAVEALETDTRVVWLVTDSVIDIPELQNRTEWVGTRIIWSIQADGLATLLNLVHEGLTPEVECYHICQAGWAQFVASLKAFAETGTGTPFKKS